MADKKEILTTIEKLTARINTPTLSSKVGPVSTLVTNTSNATLSGNEAGKIANVNVNGNSFLSTAYPAFFKALAEYPIVLDTLLFTFSKQAQDAHTVSDELSFDVQLAFLEQIDALDDFLGGIDDQQYAHIGKMVLDTTTSQELLEMVCDKYLEDAFSNSDLVALSTTKSFLELTSSSETVVFDNIAGVLDTGTLVEALIMVSGKYLEDNAQVTESLSLEFLRGVQEESLSASDTATLSLMKNFNEQINALDDFLGGIDDQQYAQIGKMLLDTGSVVETLEFICSTYLEDVFNNSDVVALTTTKQFIESCSHSDTMTFSNDKGVIDASTLTEALLKVNGKYTTDIAIVSELLGLTINISPSDVITTSEEVFTGVVTAQDILDQLDVLDDFLGGIDDQQYAHVGKSLSELAVTLETIALDVTTGRADTTTLSEVLSMLFNTIFNETIASTENISIKPTVISSENVILSEVLSMLFNTIFNETIASTENISIKPTVISSENVILSEVLSMLFNTIFNETIASTENISIKPTVISSENVILSEAGIVHMNTYCSDSYVEPGYAGVYTTF
jgi:hypothetical protein